MANNFSYLNKFKIGNIEISPPLILAPMSGITNYCFRELIAFIGGCGLFFTQMISAEGLARDNKKTKNLLRNSPHAQPLFCQIFGSDPEVMGKAVSVLKEKKVSGIDINMSCPTNKIVKKGAGSALLKDIKLAEKIIRMVVKKANPIPVSVKIRAGWSKKEINVIEFSKMIEDSGASAIIVHPRVRSDFFSYNANWKLIFEVKKNVSIPVIGNGDVKNPQDISDMFEQTGCDGVMIGRGAVQDPLIFKKFLDLKRRIEFQYKFTKKFIFLKYIEILENENLDTKEKLSTLKKFSLWFTKKMENGKSFRKRIILSRNFQEAKEIVEEFFIAK
jgi:tRNA-dihydrouridine synthase B